MHVAPYRKINLGGFFVTLCTNILSIFLIMPDFISTVYLFTLTRKSNYNCLKDSKQLLNEPAIEKKEKKNNNNNKNKYKRN